jgi:hypothetical protein
MTGRELLNQLQALTEEVLAKSVVICHPNGGYNGLSHTSVLPVGTILQLSPPPTEAESKAALKEVEDRLWAGSRVEKDGSVASVDPDDLKKVWAMQQEVQARAQEHGFGLSVGAIGLGVFANACSPGADVTAVWYLVSMLRMLCLIPTLLSAWMHDGKPDDVIFRVAAKFPISEYPWEFRSKECPLTFRNL